MTTGHSPRTTAPDADDEHASLPAAWDRWHEITGHDPDSVVGVAVRGVLEALWPVAPRQLKQLVGRDKPLVLLASAYLVGDHAGLAPADAAAIIRAFLHRESAADHAGAADRDPAEYAAAIHPHLVAVFDGPLDAAAKVLRAAPMPMADLARLVPLGDDALAHESTSDLDAHTLATLVPGGPRVLLDALTGPDRNYDILSLPRMSRSGADRIALLRRSPTS